MKREKAVAVGNRAGVVEWANAAWSRVTGYALEDAIAKPVGDLLATAGIDHDVIDFVRQRFERGEPCEIELPLAPPDPGTAPDTSDGRPRWIHISIESLRDRHGEVSHFAAIAWDVTAEKREAARRPAPEVAAAPQRRDPARRTGEPLRLATTDLSAFVGEVVARRAEGGHLRTSLDVALPDGLPSVGVDRDHIAETLVDLLDAGAAAIGDEWGTLSVSTGIARSEAVFVSPTFPRNCLLRGLAPGHYVWVEVHDTGPPVDPTLVAALAGAELPASATGRVARLAAARAVLQAHGGALRLDADAGFGTRVILLFPG